MINRTLGSGGTSASISANAHVTASAGLMRAGIDGVVTASWAQTGQFSSARLSTAVARVVWQDYFQMRSVVSSGDPTYLVPGTPVIVDALLNIGGTMDINFSTDPNALTQADLDLVIVGTDGANRNLLPTPPFGFWGQEFQSSNSTEVPIHHPPPSVIPVRMMVNIDLPTSMSFLMEVRADAMARNTKYVGPGSASTTFDANFTHTLSWGGITSVTDANSGLPVSNWSIISASGVDYAHAVPEPSALALLAAYWLPLITRRGRPIRDAAAPRAA
jgi:hypothetical protein